MLICLEGPDCSGKTTHVKELAKYIEKNYNLKVKTFHFPSHTPTSGYHVDQILADRVRHNNHYTAMSYIIDMYNTIYIKEGDRFPVIEAIESKDTVVLFDRYYYSSLTMCKYWPAMDEVTEDFKKSYIDDFRKDLMRNIQRLNLPAPDLNLVLIPKIETVLERIKSKSADADIFETEEKSKQFYAAYVDAVTVNFSALFGANDEKLPPIVIGDTKTSSIGGKYFEDDPACNVFYKAARARLSKTKDEISNEIALLFDSYIDMVNEKTKKDHASMDRLTAYYPGGVNVSTDEWLAVNLIKKITPVKDGKKK